MEQEVKDILGKAYDLFSDLKEQISAINEYDKIQEVLNEINELYL